jgi:carbon monoxide dehydrogenase subunit G
VELTHEFTVPASVDDAWAAFNDLARIAPCFPGASLTAYDGEQFEGLVKVKLGPISLQYTGAGRFVERDEASHRAVIEAKGKDKRGNGTAAATITASLASAGATATDVTVATVLNITGKPAQFGRSVMQDVSDKLLAQFAACLETTLGEEPAAVDDAAVSADETPEPAAPADLGKTPPADSQFGDKLGKRAGESSIGEEGREAVSGRSGASEPSAALDLGAALLPVIIRRFAPHIMGAVIGLWLLRKIFGRRRRRRR